MGGAAASTGSPCIPIIDSGGSRRRCCARVSTDSADPVAVGFWEAVGYAKQSDQARFVKVWSLIAAARWHGASRRGDVPVQQPLIAVV